MTSSLRPSDLEEFTKRRRLVQDLELDVYIRNKATLIDLIEDLKTEKDSVELDEFKEKLELAEAKIIMSGKRAQVSAEAEEMRLDFINQALETYDDKTNEHLREALLQANEESDVLVRRLEATTELLKMRRSINNTIETYLTEVKVIKMKRFEVEELFKNDVKDLSTIFASGRLVYEDKEKREEDQFEFKFDKSTGFKKSIQELKEAIDEKIKECAIIEERMKMNKAKWMEVSVQLNESLSAITENIEI